MVARVSVLSLSIFFCGLRRVRTQSLLAAESTRICNYTSSHYIHQPPIVACGSPSPKTEAKFSPFSALSGAGKMSTFAAADACDSNPALVANGDLRVLQPIFKIYGQRRGFSGAIVTVKVFEDNVLVRQLLETRGEGRVLVIDGGGSMRCALLGGNLAQSAHSMGWSGIVINGCVRDVDEINGFDIGVRALGSNPLKSFKKGHGETHVPVYVGGTLIRNGEWLYADSDGVLVSKTELSV